jgi:hypothetical protein
VSANNWGGGWLDELKGLDELEGVEGVEGGEQVRSCFSMSNNRKGVPTTKELVRRQTAHRLFLQRATSVQPSMGFFILAFHFAKGPSMVRPLFHYTIEDLLAID